MVTYNHEPNANDARLNPVVSVVIPAYNEEAGITEFYKRMSAVMRGTGLRYELIFIDDGSRDDTLFLLRELRAADDRVKIVEFARNFGHQIAVTAGLDYARGDAIVIIDADLQDPPEVIPRMLDKYREGLDVVYGKRAGRAGESAFKKATAWMFYRMLSKVTSCDIPADTGDFRLVSRRAADAARSMREHNRFMRGMFAWIGFRSCAVEFERDRRFAGETKYPMRKMLALASNGVFSYSMKPLGWMAGFGAFMTVAGLAWLIVMLILFITGHTTGGFLTALACAVVVECAGWIIVSMGIVGAYVGRIYQEAQGRPLYLVADTEGLIEQFERPTEKSVDYQEKNMRTCRNRTAEGE